MWCHLFQGFPLEPECRHGGNWKQSCQAQTVCPPLEKLQPQCHSQCAASFGAVCRKNKRIIIDTSLGQLTDCPLDFNHNYNQKHLLHVSLCIGQFGGDVEHEFLPSEHSVDRLRPRLTMRHIQTTSKPEYMSQSEN